MSTAKPHEPRYLVFPRKNSPYQGTRALQGFGVANSAHGGCFAMLLERKFGWMFHALPSLPRNPPIRPRWTRESALLSSVQSLYECRAETIITHAPSMSDACETHAQSVEKSIASLVL